MNTQQARIDFFKGIDDGVVPHVVVAAFDAQGVCRHASHHEGFVVGIEVGIHIDAVGAEGSQRLEQFFRGCGKVLSAIELKAEDCLGAGIGVDDGADFVELGVMLFDVGARAVGQLFFAGEKHESDGVLGANSEHFKDASGFEHRGNTGAVVVGALRGVPGIEMRRQ